MFGKVIVFGLFEMILYIYIYIYMKSEDYVPGFGLGLRVGYDGAGRHRCTGLVGGTFQGRLIIGAQSRESTEIIAQSF